LGFIWFATQDGLNRYDGSYFIKHEVFFKDNTQSEYSQLGELHVDDANRIWMTTLSGDLQFYDQQEGAFKNIDGIENVSDVLQHSSTSYFVSSFGSGLYRINLENENYVVTHLIEDTYIKKIVKSDDLILLTDHGVIKYNPETDHQIPLFKELGHISDFISFKNDEFVFAANGNKLYLSTVDGSYSEFSSLAQGSIIQDLLLDSNDRLWVATRGKGVFLFEDDQWVNFQLDPLNPGSISYNDVLSIFEDKQGNLWFGTDGGGVNFLAGNSKPIQLLTNSLAPNNIPVDVPRALSTDSEGNLWIGTSGKGLSKISKAKNQSKNYNVARSSSQGFTSDRIVSLYHDDSGDLWVGTQEGGLLKKKKYQEQFQKINNGLPANTIWDIEEANENSLWICTRTYGLLIVDKKTENWRPAALGIEGMGNSNVRVIAKGKPGQFFIGTEAGKVFEITDFKISRGISINVKDLGPIKSLLVQNDKLWIGSQKSGLIVKDLKGTEEWHIDKSKGLPNNVVYGILPQNENSIWISTNDGICQIDQKKLMEGEQEFIKQHLTIANGLVSNEFNTGAYHINEMGVMYFGGIDGVNWFSPNEILKDFSPMNVVLLDVITTGQKGQEVTRITNKSSIELKSPVRNFQLRYVAQSFSKTSKTKYRYQLEGINEDWVDNETNELVSFSNIPPGEYNFKLRCTNRDGVWSKTPVELSINIKPLFWQTWWFKILSLLLGIGLLWYLYSVRVNELKRTSALKEQLGDIKAKALKLQMNPHFLFNSLNAIDHYILKNEKVKASDYLSKFSKLMRQILDHSELNQISLAQELETLELYINIEQLRFQDTFTYDIDADEGINLDHVMVPPLIFQPFVENAIWHGLMHLNEGGKLKIQVRQEGELIKCIIQDNGIGRQKAEEINTKSAMKKKSYGMSITEKRLSLNNDLNKVNSSVKVHDKMNEDGTSAGTSIEINIPM